MIIRWMADGVLLLHLFFILFALFGGVLALRWRWFPLVHLPAAAWGVWIEISGRLCPLTALENTLRRQAGEAGYAESFIEHYLLDVIYPAGLTMTTQYVLATVVVVINLAIYLWLFARSRQRIERKP